MLVIPKASTLDFLHPLPVDALWGVGKVSAENLHRHGLHTVRDLANTPPDTLRKWLGNAAGSHLHELSWGRDPRHVDTRHIEKSVGHENTFSHDTADRDTLRRELLDQSERVAVRLRRGGWESRTISIKLRYSDFTTITRARTIAEPTDVARRIYETTTALLDEQELGDKRIRLIGVRAEQLVHAGERDSLSLWDEADNDGWRDAEQVMDAATERFGRGAILPARLLGRKDRLYDTKPPDARTRPARLVVE